MGAVPGCGGGAYLHRRRRVLLSILLHNIVLQDHIRDRWRWLLDHINGYSVKGTYYFLTTVDAPPESGLFDDVWHK